MTYPLNTPEREALVRDGAPPPADDHELVDDGQEEVVSRTEAEQGRIEHQAEARSSGPAIDQPQSKR